MLCYNAALVFKQTGNFSEINGGKHEILTETHP